MTTAEIAVILSCVAVVIAVAALFRRGPTGHRGYTGEAGEPGQDGLPCDDTTIEALKVRMREVESHLERMHRRIDYLTEETRRS